METVKIVHKSYKFRIYPTKAQVKTLEMTLDLCRELYNAALQERRDAWRLERKSVSYFEQQNQLPVIRKIREDVKTVNAQVLQDVLRRIDKIYQNYFKRVTQDKKIGNPRFKGKNRYNSFTYPSPNYSAFFFSDNKLHLSKIGKIKIKVHREIAGTIKTCTIIRNSTGKWFASISVECEKEVLEPINRNIGLDVGLTHFATLSNGEIVSNPRFFKTDEKALANAQRKLSREKKGSKERNKRRKVVARIYERIKNRRNNFAHQFSRNLVNNFDKIFFEDLNIKGMMKNHCLAKAIGDAAWNQTIAFTKYKAENAGRLCALVNPRNTSQNCSGCGVKVEKSLSERVHNCTNCKLVMDRDLNAAKNILTLGLQSLDLS